MHVEPASTLYVLSVGQRTTHAVPPYVPAASITVPSLVVVPTVAVTTEANAPFAAMFVLHVMVVASAATPVVSMMQVRIFLVASIVHMADCAVPLAAALKAHGGGELRFPAHKVFSRGRSSHSDTILYITIFHS